jgi:hypothetical protein
MNSRRTSLEDTLEVYCTWICRQPIKRTLAVRNYRGRNIIYLRGKIGGGNCRHRQALAAIKKGWYAHEQQMD